MAATAEKPRTRRRRRPLPDRLSAEQVGAVMLQGGFPADRAVIATGIGIVTAESSRNRRARNSAGNNPPSTDRGPWQINDYWHKEVTDECAHDWLCSTRAAARISSNGSSWSQWATYRTGIGGAYARAADAAIADARAPGGSELLAAFNLPALPNPGDILEGLGGAGADIAGVGGDIVSAIPDAISRVADVLAGIADFFIRLGELLLTPEGWVRLGKLLGGVLLLWLGLVRLVDTSSGGAITKAVANIAGGVGFAGKKLVGGVARIPSRAAA